MGDFQNPPLSRRVGDFLFSPPLSSSCFQWMLNGCSMDAEWMLNGCWKDAQWILKWCSKVACYNIPPLSCLYLPAQNSLFPRFRISAMFRKSQIFRKNTKFICICNFFFVILHRLSERTDKTYWKFAFAIYWKLRNVRSFRDMPIISQQTSILYMGVTYRRMGTSHSLGVGKEALIFLFIWEYT